MNLKNLLLTLYNAESSEAVYEILKENDLDGPEYWKPYGDNINNAGTFENQQSSPENALVEKLTNSIDAILMKQCKERNIDPKSGNPEIVPQDMSSAVETFYGVRDGKWENKTEPERNTVAQGIQIILTESRKTPNIAIYDDGEGQNPENFPNTFLSIAKGNKNDIPFVQGKYNFGATGAVVFCGDEHRYQMIISRRNNHFEDANGKIGFTLVRRHILSPEEERNYKLTWYEYLVIDGNIPSVDGESLELGLNKRQFEYGSVVKMFSYQLTRPSDATLDLWRQLNPLLFVPALPILIVETRYSAGHSQTKLMLGNRTRLSLDDREHISFTKSLQTTLFNSNIPVTVYIFDRKTKNPEFVGGKSVIYTLNGQTQGAEGKTFISQDLGFRNLREYMLVCVDCSEIGTTARQELFMASRDRLKQGKYYTELKNDIISLIKDDPSIIEMDQEYKGKAFKEKGDDKELIESLFSELKSNNDIKNMFSNHNGAFSFFSKKKKKTEKGEKKKDKKEKDKDKVKLQRYPSYFKVKGFDTDQKNYIKAIRKGERGRVVIETDVENDFLSRSYDNGTLTVTTLDYGNSGGPGGGQRFPSSNAQKLKVHTAGPYDGEIRLIIEPKEVVNVGENIPLSIKMVSSAGEHEVIVFVKIEEKAPESKKEKRTEKQPELTLPHLIRVYKEPPNEEDCKWSDCGMDQDKIVVLDIDSSGAVEAIRINMDSNLVKKLVNAKGANTERVRNKYLRAVYSHSLMIYTTMYGYYSREDNELDEETRKAIQDDLNEAVSFSFNYYTPFILSFEDMNDI